MRERIEYLGYLFLGVAGISLAAALGLKAPSMLRRPERETIILQPWDSQRKEVIIGQTAFIQSKPFNREWDRSKQNFPFLVVVDTQAVDLFRNGMLDVLAPTSRLTLMAEAFDRQASVSNDPLTGAVTITLPFDQVAMAVYRGYQNQPMERALPSFIDGLERELLMLMVAQVYYASRIKDQTVDRRKAWQVSLSSAREERISSIKPVIRLNPEPYFHYWEYYQGLIDRGF